VKQRTWPKADFVVGNPPFIGGKDMRQELPGGYTDALRKLYDDVPDSADFVMFWWERAAELARAGSIRRFGFITTNSLTQVFNHPSDEDLSLGTPASYGVGHAARVNAYH
jgi:methylase of polypeptide subunit release factors